MSWILKYLKYKIILNYSRSLLNFQNNIEYKTFNPWLNVGILQINDILFKPFENLSAKISKQNFWV